MSKVKSRLAGFYKLSIDERRETLAKSTGVALEAFEKLSENGGMTMELADHMVENAVATYALPMGIALNFALNGDDVLVPMVTEEPSVIAAASNAARLIREGGGFIAESDPPLMIAQVHLLEVQNVAHAMRDLQAKREDLLLRMAEAAPGLVRRGGGPRDIELRVLDDGSIVVHLIVHTCDAMGANAVNTIAEKLAPRLAEIARARSGLKILSNLADRRLVRVKGKIPVSALTIDTPELKAGGDEVRDRIVEASRFAELDPYRAATHNKGIMNGIDAVAIATGQDFRGIEAGAHAFAAHKGRYEPLAVWTKTAAGDLEGVIELPMAIGTVGGAVTFHPGAKLAMQLLAQPNTERLGQILAAAGLASNLAAIRALATEGIQRGHMSLHARRVQFQATPNESQSQGGHI
ncbi:MAG: hydroxymethylglutaryl-CoA reductase, degradative [Deltaproteobacteria bacterium]|nr:hydroxymethylglutaryl-CoA reductase, degradative [Deltaproteobacteria bacterium]